MSDSSGALPQEEIDRVVQLAWKALEETLVKPDGKTVVAAATKILNVGGYGDKSTPLTIPPSIQINISGVVDALKTLKEVVSERNVTGSTDSPPLPIQPPSTGPQPAIHVTRTFPPNGELK
jgi:hypothetical protein